MDFTRIQIKPLEGKSNWLNWKGRVSILLRGTPDVMDVVEGKLKKPDEPRDDSTEAEVTAYQTAYSKFLKADCSAMVILSTNMSDCQKNLMKRFVPMHVQEKFGWNYIGCLME